MAIQHTTEFAATSPAVIQAIVDELKSSARKFSVFQAIYSGGNKPKNATFLASKTGLIEVVVLQLATPMAHKQYFEKTKDGGRVAFRKYQHINAVRHDIFRLVRSGNSKSKTTIKAVTTPKIVAKNPKSIRAKRTHRRTLIPTHDVFVSHASEDKDFVKPLVKALKRARIRVWYDENMIGWGDDLRSAIDRGLANSRYGIVVFSKSFLKGKKWTEHELDGLFAKERLRQRVILPIWHKIKRADLLKYSPTFADRVAKVTQKDSITNIVEGVQSLLRRK